ncbi:MAG: NUDIX hydrolase [Pseudomonadales bacterium]|nr:NUDIX hydrolase [Pseudomonadales bacterium]
MDLQKMDLENKTPEPLPVRPAATVLLIDDRPDLKVFIMKRNPKHVFGPGMWVFPGGAVDSADHHKDFSTLRHNHQTVDNTNLINSDIITTDLAYQIAAIREVFEEAGILIAAYDQAGNPLSLLETEQTTRFQRHRDAVNDNSANFRQIINTEKLQLNLSKLHYIARWITPVGATRRFDARFFIALMPSNQTADHDNNELIQSDWLSPASILSKHSGGELQLMAPTLRMIQSLAKFKTASQAIDAAAHNQTKQRVRVNQHNDILLPGDTGWETADENIETGWIKLRPLDAQLTTNKVS